MQAFFDVQDFDWTNDFLDNWDTIRSEIDRALNWDWTPLYSHNVETENAERRLRAWTSLSFIFFTIQNPVAFMALPKLGELIFSVPDLVTANILKLEGGTHLTPHRGYSPDVLRFHLGTHVPEPNACSIRVESEVRHWKEGDWLVFDDYLEHEVWNKGTQNRTVLMIDVVRPEQKYSPHEVGRRFFDLAPGIHFDEDLKKQASIEQWKQWFANGQFS